MISPEYTSTLFNPIPFHEQPLYFDRVSGQDDYSSAQLQTTGQQHLTHHQHQHSLSSKDMFTQPQDSFTDSFPPHYPAFRRMSADTQASSADSASPDHKPITNDKMASLVLPPIHDLSRPLSPQTSDASSTRSPQWQQQQAPQQQQQQQQQHQHHPHQHPHHHQQQQHYPPPPQPAPYNFPPIDQHRARPQLHINPPDYRTQTGSYPTPTTANGHNTSSSTGSTQSAYSSSTYTPYPVRRPEEQQQQQHYRQVAPPPPGPPVVTGATLATAVGLQTRRRGKLPKPVTEFLKKWLLAHTDHPYPTEDEKKWLCSETGLSMSQVSNWMINARRRILAPAAKANAAAAAAAASANAAVTSSATATAATPYYSRSPPVRTVSGSSSSDYANGSHYSAPRRDSSYAPYPMPASRVTNSHQPQHQHHYSSPATSYPTSASPYSAAAASAYHFQSPTPVPAGHAQGPNSAPLPPALAPYASTTLAPFGDSHESNHGSERTKSPGGDFAYAPQ